MTAEPPFSLEGLAQRMSETPQAAALGFRFISVGNGEAVLAAPHRPELVGDAATGVLAGGVVTTLLDHVCGMAVSSRMMAERGIAQIATLDLRIDYMRAAEPGREVIARAHCYKTTHAIAFVRATAYDADETDPVATAQAAFAITGRPENAA